MSSNCIFIFRRDFRLHDNTGLNWAIKNCQNIIPIFIFTPEQIKNNKYFSENAVQFMIESLKDLNKNLKKYDSKLHIFQGDNVEILKKISKKINIDKIVFNMDYTPYAIKRDKQIQSFCDKQGIECVMKQDYLLSNMGDLNKKDKSPYNVFTPFKNNGLKYNVKKPEKITIKNLIKKKLDEDGYIDYKINENLNVNGGRKNAKKKLKNLKNFKNYNDTRNNLDENTTHLSAYIKFGCVSIREVFHKIKKILGINSGLINQLFWREFYFYIAYYFPFVLKKQNLIKKYDKIKWNTDNKLFKKWTKAKTGFPVVDAGMTQLNQTGYMHNRARLITSNFLNRMLGYHWSKGEKYFAQKLVDYDPSVNNGNWQWIASTGVDPKPYFQRLFNPKIQSKKFDIDGEYIKKWLPELKDVDSNDLHDWEKNHKKYNVDYPKPVVNYQEARKKSQEMYKKVL